MEFFLNWPFGSKGHYHLPSAIAPVLLDFLVKSSSPGEFTLIHDSWNVQGRYTDSQALTRLERRPVDEGRYESALAEHLPDIMTLGKEISDSNIAKSRDLKERLGLLPSGVYRNGKFVAPASFRDDSAISWKVAQERFLQLYSDGLVYSNGSETPQFFLNTRKLMDVVPFERLTEGLILPSFALKQFENAYSVYDGDMPLSASGAYGTPLPLFIGGKNIKVPSRSDLPVDPRLDRGKVVGKPLVLKPLFNCYLFPEIVGRDLGIEPERVVTCNDHGLMTRFNFPQSLLTRYFDRSYTQKMFFNDLLVDNNGERYSFKGNSILSLEDLTKDGPALARFLVARNTRFVGSKLRFEDNRSTLRNVKKVVSGIRANGTFTEDDKRVVFSKMFKKDVKNLGSMYAEIAGSGEVCRAVNFLVDYLNQASGLNGGTLPLSVKEALDCLESILLI